MRWGQVAGLALGVMKSVDLTKEALAPYGIPPEWSKSVLVVALSVAGATVLEDTWSERLLAAGATAGAASMAHEFYALLTTSSDRNKQQVITNGARLAASSGRRVQVPS